MSERLCRVHDLGRVSYDRAERLQRQLLQARRAGTIPDTLLVVEHDPVVTVGSAVDDPADELSLRALEEAGVEVRRVSRGGRATFHGPGQIVGYPILDLRRHRQDLHWYLRALEQVLIDALAQVGCEAERRDGLTGVWVQGRKVASIGIAVRGWVTWHGFALNRDCDARWWRMLDPCGLRPEQMASLSDLAEETPSRRDVVEKIVGCFGDVFGLRPVRAPETELFQQTVF